MERNLSVAATGLQEGRSMHDPAQTAPGDE